MKTGTTTSGDPDGHVSHLDLLRHARVLEDTAFAGDRDAVHRALCELRNALLAHLHTEEREIESLAAPVERAVRSGQGRLAAAVEELLTTAITAQSCDCVSESLHLTAALVRQARVEGRLLAARRGDSIVSRASLRKPQASSDPGDL